MTEEGRDPKVSARYAELAREQPPRALDDAILAAARREAGARPAPLVAPAGRRRWYFPLAAAAVIVLAVSVTLQVERERPDAAAPAQQATAKPAADAVPAGPPQKPAAAASAAAPERPLVARPGAAQRGAVIGVEPPKPAIESRRFTPDPGPPVAARPAPGAAPLPAAPARAEEAPAAGAGSTGTMAGAPSAGREVLDSAARSRAAEPGAIELSAKRLEAAADTPERQLERIAELRRQGRHDAADKALVEFRKRNPDYRIPQQMLEKVLPPR